MKKLLWILAVLSLAATAMLFRSCSGAPSSRQMIELAAADFPRETDCAVQAVKAFASAPAQFANYWQSRGDIYSGALRYLKSHPMKDPVVKRVYRYGSSEHLLMVELTEPGVPDLVVTVWRGGDRCLVTEMAAVANGGKDE